MHDRRPFGLQTNRLWRISYMRPMARNLNANSTQSKASDVQLHSTTHVHNLYLHNTILCKSKNQRLRHQQKSCCKTVQPCVTTLCTNHNYADRHPKNPCNQRRMQDKLICVWHCRPQQSSLYRTPMHMLIYMATHDINTA